MALFLRPANVQKNIAATFTLDLAELAALPVVPAGYYKDISNWKEIFVKVKNVNSDQNVIIHYKLPSNQAPLLVSDTARAGVWEIYSILIRDYDRGEVVVHKQDIPDQSDYNFYVVSAATHGDLIVTNGMEVVLPANGTRQYGDVIIDAGGVVRLADGGGILELDVLGNCIINGTILANNGKHTGGTWSKTSVLGENLVHTVIQKAGGNGGDGEGISAISSLSKSVWSHNEITYNFLKNTAGIYGISEEEFNSIAIGTNINITSLYVGGTSHGQIISKSETYDNLEETYFYSFEISVEPVDQTLFNQQSNFGGGLTFEFEIAALSPGGTGGLAAFGNGGGGGRSAKFIAQAGGDAIDIYAGQGVAQAVVADEYGENGVHSTAPVNTAGGGFRGAHGQALYIKAARIQGTGTINASGQKGGDGGNGGEYLADGELWANGAGGGAAGGDGGKIWLRAKKGTPVLSINVQGGERGARGVASPGSTEAGHGQNGSPGVYDFQLF